VEIINKKPPKATFVDFHSCGIYAALGINAVGLTRYRGRTLTNV
jgi:hypothetical protein